MLPQQPLVAHGGRPVGPLSVLEQGDERRGTQASAGNAADSVEVSREIPPRAGSARIPIAAILDGAQDN